jgi:tetratricopeptide (TPR) repeat protein
MDEALAAYQRALQLEPTLYEAALFSADVFLNKADYPQAETWYQKAIAIDPARETAYRYSATPLMKQSRYDEALGRYVEAYITDPYNRQTAGGLTLWAQATHSELEHPEIAVGGAPANCDRPPCRTVALEATALRAVARSDAAGGASAADRDLIRKLDREELLEAYILLARPDEGIARDHAAYLRDHRDRLRRYVMTYVVHRAPSQ